LKIIYTNEINSITATAALGDDYSIDSVSDDYPQHEYIAGDNSATITVSVESGTEGVFLSNWFADSLAVNMKNSVGTVLSTHTPDCTFDETLNWEGIHALQNPVFLVCPETTEIIEMVLTTSIDRKNDIADFVVSTSDAAASRGHFRDSGFTAIPYCTHPQLRIGTKVNDSQITVLSGDGTSAGNVQVNDVWSSAVTVSTLYMPVFAGIIRAGKVADFPNPNVGQFNWSGLDHSTVQKNLGGSYIQKAGGVSRLSNAAFSMTASEKDQINEIARNLRSRPFPIHPLYKEDTELDQVSFFARLTEFPQITPSNKLYNNFDVNLSLEEVI